jgi:general secretion pathway protein D
MRVAGVAIAAALLLAPIGWHSAWAQGQDPGRAGRADKDAITLNFKDADIDSVIGAFGHLLDRTFVIDPRVRGTMTLETPRPVSREQAYRLLQSALRSQGFAVVDTGALTKVVPEADAKLQSSPVTAGRAPSTAGDQIVTQIFRLNHESASNLVPVLRPLISPNNTIVAYPSNNSLVVTDYAANLQRIARIIATLDSPSTSGVEVVPIKYAIAADVAMTVSRMIDDTARASPGAQIDAGQRIVVMADPRMNAVLIRSTSAAKIGLARSLIAQLDQPSAQPGNIHVVYLRNAEAVKLAQTLSGVLAGAAGTAGAGGQGSFGTQGIGGQGGASAMSAGNIGNAMTGNQMGSQMGGTIGGQGGDQGAGAAPLQQSNTQAVVIQAGGATIAADPTTNSLIITAPDPVYRNLRVVIDKLDTRRAQVFIESLIVEISAESAAELGVQWQFLSAPEGTTRVIGGTNLPTRGTGANILDVTANIGALATGLNVGVVHGTTTLPGIGQVLNLGLLARALESKTNANILATPNLLTLDNEEARIIIGQNVPFITGQFTATGGAGGAVNPFQTIERRDVGTTLRVKPQVSESGTVRLQIFQEVSSVQSVNLAAGIVTNRRAIESNVLVDDGQIVVLGGLIEERLEGGEDKVPGLGDVPVLGQLFRYDSRKRTKTNLLVFLRPVVIRDGDAAYGVTADRYEYMRGLRADSNLPPRFLMPDNTPSEMAPLPLPPSAHAAQNAPPGSVPGLAGGPASLDPDTAAASRVPAPIYESPPTTIVPRPLSNEVVVPLDRRITPLFPDRGIPRSLPQKPSPPAFDPTPADDAWRFAPGAPD